MPVSPDVDRSSGAIVPNPHYLLIGWNSKRNPGAMYVVAPEQVIGDYPFDGVDHGHYSGERERFITLQVQDWSETPRQHSATIGLRQDVAQDSRSQRDVGARPASAQQEENK